MCVGAGAPAWTRAPSLAQSPEARAGDASLWAERWSGGRRLRIRGVREDDAAWAEDSHERLLCSEQIDAVLACLETGADTQHTVEAWGRSWRSTYSLAPPSDLWAAGEFLWFYPMSESRMVLRVEAEPLRRALEDQLLPWWRDQG